MKLDKAKEEYERLKTKWPTGVYVAVANQRLDDLNKQSTKEFYDWFVVNEPKPSISGLGEPGIRPPFDAPLQPDVINSIKQSLEGSPDESGANKSSDIKINLTPPLLGSEKDKPAKPAESPTPEKNPDEKKPDEASSKPSASETKPEGAAEKPKE